MNIAMLCKIATHLSCFPVSQQLLCWPLQCCLQFLEQLQSYLLPFCALCVTDIRNQNIPCYLIWSHQYDIYSHPLFMYRQCITIYFYCVILLCIPIYVVFSVQYAGTCTGPCQSSLITVGVDASIMIHSWLPECSACESDRWQSLLRAVCTVCFRLLECM